MKDLETEARRYRNVQIIIIIIVKAEGQPHLLQCQQIDLGLQSHFRLGVELLLEGGELLLQGPVLPVRLLELIRQE